MADLFPKEVHSFHHFFGLLSVGDLSSESSQPSTDAFLVYNDSEVYRSTEVT